MVLVVLLRASLGSIFCRFCLGKSVDIQSNEVRSGVFRCRTKEIHETHLELKLQQANTAFKANGILLGPDPKLKSSILDGLAEEIVKYKVYPTD